MEPNLNSLFNEDMGNSSNPPNDEEALHEVSVEQLSKLDNQFDDFHQWMSHEYPDSQALPLIEGLKHMLQSDKNGIDILRGISHIVNSNVMPMKSCAESLGYTQPPTQVNHSIPLTTSIASIPTFTSNIMTTSIQDIPPVITSHGGNPSSSINPLPSFNPTSSYIPSMSVPITSSQMNITQGGNSFNHSIPPCSVPPVQSSPMTNYHRVPPPYSLPSFNNITPPSQSNTSNMNSSTEATINSLAQTVSSLQQQIASMNQSKFSVPTFDVASPLSLDIVRAIPPKHVEIPHLELYNGKGDPLTHVKTFQTICIDFAYDQRLLAKLFTRTLRDKALQWYCSLPSYSITSFEQLANAFIQQFQNNISPKVTLIDLMHCKQGVKEKVTDFIGRYKHLYAQISFPVPNNDIQRIFISNIQKDIRDKLLFSEFTSFQQLCATLHNYQLTVSQMEQSHPMAPSDKGDSSQQPFGKFKPNRDSIKFNENIINNNVNVASGVPPISKFFKKERKYTPLNESLHSIMNKLLEQNVLTLPPIRQIDPAKITSPYFDNKAFCHFHRQPGHDTEKCFSLKGKIQDLIDNNTIFVSRVNDKGNTSVAPPNQNLQIFTDPLPSHTSHTSNAIEANDFSLSSDGLVSMTPNVINFVEQQEIPKEPSITFDSSETIRASDGPLYIVAKVKNTPCHGVLIDPSCMVNVITEEFLFTLQLNQVIYDKTDVVVKLFDAFSSPAIGSITLPIEVHNKSLDVNFSIIPSSEQFRVKLGYPWLSSMKAITSPTHKCLKFPHNGEVVTVNHSLFKPAERTSSVPIDYFWPKQFQSLPPQSDHLFKSYQKWKTDMILSLSEPRTPKLDIPIILEKEVLPLKDKTNVFPQEDSQPIPMDVTMSMPNKPSKSRAIPPRHDGLGLLPKPKIPPLYGAVRPPSFYREKRPSSSPIIQPKRPQPKHPSDKDENIPPPLSSSLPTKTR
ncbi:hypothetical protein SUGI_0342280 [Cryptomeria japonica]|nr:hypothetical protein SUGI_0342280 [Cryptomeria japonica]